jgi:hypothetical protein
VKRRPGNEPRERDPRKKLSVAEARALLGVTSLEIPSEDQLREDAALVIARTLELGDEVAHLKEQGLQPSPIWELDPSPAGGGAPRVRARLAVLPVQFRTRYFEGEGRATLDDPAAVQLACEALPWLLDDPVGAAVALENTLRVWLDETGPTRPLDLPYRSHLRLLSLLLADLARKGSAGLSDLEWLASLGLPIEDLREEDDPPEVEIREGAKAKLQELWMEERGWLRAAFGR